jgi:predicted SnoaL-like aldol condensation-catalyzing enzyme
MPFCGVWRFDESGRAVEHWENAAYPEALGKWLRSE